MKSPAISVIIPTYKPQGYLWTCLDSLERQTIGKEEFEVLLVLNGDRQPYEDEIRQRLDDYSFPIRLLYSSPNGVSRARNMGLDNVKGQYISFLDDDDWVSEIYLGNLLSHASDHGIVEANVIQIVDGTSEEKPHYIGRAYKKCRESGNTDLLSARSFFSTAWCKLIPNAVIADTRFREDITHGEDAFFMFLLSSKVQTIELSDEAAVYFVRNRPLSASRNKKLLGKKCRQHALMAWVYTYTYLFHPFRYNFLFTMTRVLGSLRLVAKTIKRMT